MSARGPPVPVTAPPPGKGDAKAGKGVAFRSLPREQMEDVLMNAGVDLDGAHIRSVLDGVTMPLTAARSASGRGPMILVDTQNDNLLFRVSFGPERAACTVTHALARVHCLETRAAGARKSVPIAVNGRASAVHRRPPS